MKMFKKIFIANFIFLFFSFSNSLLSLTVQEKQLVKAGAECYMRALCGHGFCSMLMCNFFNQFSKETVGYEETVFRNWAADIINKNNIDINISVYPENQKYMPRFIIKNLPQNIDIPELKIDNDIIIPAITLNSKDIDMLENSYWHCSYYLSE
ncbi:hypothetical protein K9L05_00860 [Candidatus Babeliales bacterium]|nr:hypothetical protein [Candidatus Babeliales bacterium]